MDVVQVRVQAPGPEEPQAELPRRGLGLEVQVVEDLQVVGGEAHRLDGHFLVPLLLQRAQKLVDVGAEPGLRGAPRRLVGHVEAGEGELFGDEFRRLLHLPGVGVPLLHGGEGDGVGGEDVGRLPRVLQAPDHLLKPPSVGGDEAGVGLVAFHPDEVYGLGEGF